MAKIGNGIKILLDIDRVLSIEDIQMVGVVGNKEELN
jgi:hypothetical protein